MNEPAFYYCDPRATSLCSSSFLGSPCVPRLCSVLEKKFRLNPNLKKKIRPLSKSWNPSRSRGKPGAVTRKFSKSGIATELPLVSSSHLSPFHTQRTPCSGWKKMRPALKKTRSHQASSLPSASMTICSLVENRAREACIAVIKTSHSSVLQVR